MHRRSLTSTGLRAINQCQGLLIPSIAAFLLSVVLPTTAVSGNWPTVGGSSMRNGRTDEVGPTGPDVVWEGSVSAWFGGQTYIEADRMVTMRFQGISYAPIVCYDLATGQEHWSIDFPGTNSRSVPRGFRDGKVYATNFQETGQDTLYALDPMDGSILWTSEAFCERGIIWSAAFAPNGDLLVPSAGSDIARVDHLDGSEVYEIERIIPNTGAETICVHGNTIYGFEGSITTPKVLTAWNLDDGEKRYSSATLPGHGDQEIPFTIAPDGTIYVLRDGGQLHALIDTGEAIIERWRVPIDTNPQPTYSQFGIGLDGSLYLPDGAEIARLDPLTGAEIDRSPSLVSTSTLNARITIGANGTVYVGNGGFDDGALYAFSPELDVLWSDAIPSIVYAGPAIGEGGLLAVAGSGTVLKVYGPNPEAVGDPAALAARRAALRCHPNPFRRDARISIQLAEAARISLSIFDIEGRRIRSLIDGDHLGPGTHSLAWEGDIDAGGRAGSGTYFLIVETDRQREVRKIQKVH